MRTCSDCSLGACVPVVTVVLTRARVVVDLVTLATAADGAGVGGELEVGGRLVLVAALAVVDVLTQHRRILWHLHNYGCHVNTDAHHR